MPPKKPSRFYGINSKPYQDQPENNAFSLRGFLEENYTLFALLGIFGALSVYLNQLGNSLGQNSRALKIGVAGSLAIVLVIVSLLIRDVLDRCGGGDQILRILLSDENEYRTILFFLVPFAGVVYTFISLIGNFSASLSILLQLGAGMFGIIAGSKFFFRVEEETNFDLSQTNFFEHGIVEASTETLKIGGIGLGGYLATDLFRSGIAEDFGSAEIIYTNGQEIPAAVMHAAFLGAEAYCLLFLAAAFLTWFFGNLASGLDRVIIELKKTKESMSRIYYRMKDWYLTQSTD